jgi:HPt (histidine-containing phosphotransfer) domain-containing protein
LNNLTPHEIPENVLNVDSALEMLGGDMDLLREVVEMFLTDLPNKLEELRTGIAQSDPDKVRRVAHSLKGAAANIAAEDVRSSAFEIEQLASNGDLDSVVTRVPELERRIQALVEAIRVLQQEPPKAMSRPE